MTQDQRWQIWFDEVMNFMEKEQRKLSKYSPKEKFEKLLALCEEYKRVKGYV